MTQTIRERAVEGVMHAMIVRRGVPDDQRTDGMMAVFSMDATAAYDAILATLSEPTHDMIEAGIVHDNLTSAGLRDAWRAMLVEAGR